MTAPLRPRRLAHRGVVDAVGLLVDRTDEAIARARVLARWSPGTTVYALGAQYAVMFGTARRVPAAPCEGAALVRCAGSAAVTLCSTAPLSRAEVDRLVQAGARADHLVLARGGCAEPVALDPASLVDPSAWIDLGPMLRLDVASLGAPPVVVVVAPSTDAPTLRPEGTASMAAALSRALGALVARGAVTPEAAALVSATVTATTTVAPTPRPARGLSAWWGALTRLLDDDPAPDPSVRALPPVEGSAPTAAAPPRGWWSRLRGWLREKLVRSQVQRALGADQAGYLDRMIEMFRQGDLDAALRHAIPLGGPRAPDAPHQPLTWETPRARDALAIQLAPTTHATATGGDSLHALLRMLYRDAAKALEAEGRIDEAAFTLAELLREPGEAVALLERHGRLRLAAELAETARLAPELRTRQWLLAGDPSRALAVMRLHGSFAAVLTSLKDNPTGVDALRTLWSRHLASVGDLAAAVQVGAPVAALADEVDAWGSALLALGGTAAHRVLARRLSQHPERFAALRSHLDAMADADGPEALSQRANFAALAVAEPWSEGLALAARLLVRPQCRDAARTNDPADLQALQTLLNLARDPVLRADVPTWPTFARMPLASRPEPWRHTIDAADTGPTALYDAVFARAQGTMLLALGESGASLRDRDGRERARYDAPTHAIVWSDHGDRALLLGARGAGWMLSRLDLLAGRCTAWGECTLDAFASDYDGDGWLVGQRGEVLLLDATAPDLRALPGPGRVPQTSHTRVHCVARDATGAAAVRALTQVERWRWRLPGWALLERLLEAPGAVAVAVDATGVVARRHGAGLYSIDRGASQPLVQFAFEAETTARVAHLAPPWVVFVESVAGVVTVALWHLTASRRLVELRLEGSGAAHGRVVDEVLTVCDDRGRALAVDLRSGTLLRDLRV